MMARRSCFTLFLAVLMGVAALPLQSSPLPLTGRQLAAGSPHVVVAVVEDARSLWNAKHTLIVTEYDLRIENRLKGNAPERVTLTVPGGTVGGERHLTSLSTFLETGARYLLFLEDFGRPTLSPVTGAWQGVYPEKALGAGGFGDTLAAARELVAEAEARPKAADTAWRARRAENPALPAKAWDSGNAKFTVLNPPAGPVSWDLIPQGQPFFHVDWDMMAYWNVYAEVFRGADQQSATWAFGNGVFDIAGFPPSAQMQEQLGRDWDTSPGFTMVRIQDDHIVEADIAFNPAYEWTTDDDAATRPGGPISFKHLMLAHLGLAWGYNGPANLRDSILLDPIQPYSLATLFAEDAAAVRSTYPGTSVLDGVISPYSLKRASRRELAYVPVRASASSVRAGRTVELRNPVKIENPGTEAFNNPTVEVYLVPQRFSMEGAILLKTVRLRGRVRSGEAKTLALGQVRVPDSVPDGTYYFAFELDVPRDGYPSNNRAWSNHDVKITVRR